VSVRGQQHLWVVQRLTAMILAAAVLVHLVTILVAVRGGLSAGEIIGRLRGNEAWLAFYAVFALAAGLHGAIGLRVIAAEWLGWRGRGFDLAWLALGLLTALFGIRAAAGMYAA
jgi:fumarate reductase subunit C